MRALRILLIVAVILGGLFALADRVAVHFAEGEVADRLRTTENLATTPDVSINGFPFLTQLAGGELDDVEVGIKGYEAATGNGGEKVRIDDLHAQLKGVRFSGDYSSATASDATGTALISYGELLRAAKSEPTDVGPGVSARVIGLSDGGNGKIKVTLTFTALGIKATQPVSVLSSVTVRGNSLDVHADGLPRLDGITLVENRIRAITDFRQGVARLPGDIRLATVRAAKDGVEITAKGSDVRLAG
ncbi:LmeA family phospholipid-binding protein [Streptomyces sp. NPDC002519]